MEPSIYALSNVVCNDDGSPKFGFATDLDTGQNVYVPRGVLLTHDITETDIGQRFVGYTANSVSAKNPRLGAFLNWEDEKVEQTVDDLDHVYGILVVVCDTLTDLVEACDTIDPLRRRKLAETVYQLSEGGS